MHDQEFPEEGFADKAAETTDWEAPAPTSKKRSFGSGQTRTVELLNMDDFRGRYLVVDLKTKQSYLVPKEHLKFTSGPQEVAQSVLDVADRPYDWDDEIEALALTKDEIRLGLHYAGLIEPASLNFKEFVSRLLRSGKFPIRKDE
jgi:hypothetical protein